MTTIWRPLIAEWLRLSRRWDVWLIAALAIGATVWLYVSAFRETTGAMGIGGGQGSWGSGDGTTAEPWFVDAMLSLRQPFAFPGSLLTILDSVWVLTPLGAYLAIVTIGPDFWWGTVRSILIVRRSRVAYLGFRLGIIMLVVAGSLLLVFLIASIIPLVLMAMAGERFPAGSIQLDTFGALLGTRLIAALGYALIAALATLLARSLAGGVVLVAAAAATEFAIGAVTASIGAPQLRELTFSGALSSIAGQLRPPPLEMVVDYEAGALVPATQQPAAPEYFFDVGTSAAVVIVWVLIVAGLAIARMRSMDISD